MGNKPKRRERASFALPGSFSTKNQGRKVPKTKVVGGSVVHLKNTKVIKSKKYSPTWKPTDVINKGTGRRKR